VTVRPEVAVGGVAVHDGALLVVRRGRGPAAGEWSVPGGRVEPGETLRAAVAREVLEETGLEVVVDRFLGWVERISDEFHFVILDFAVTVLDPQRDPVPADDAVDVAWVPLQELSERRLVDGLYEFLHDVGIVA
jgi:8-oxo-dGTP diphosphatase